MKPIVIFGLTIFLILISLGDIITKNLKSKFKKTQKSKSKKSKQVRLVQDHTKFKSGINQVTRRDPTVTVTTKIGSEKLAAPPTILHMHNSNTSNGPNIGTFGPSAEIVGPHMVMHSKGSFTTLSEEPAHIGWRNDRKVLTTLNRATGKMEQHQTTNRSPIYGTVQKIGSQGKSASRELNLATMGWAGGVGEGVSV